MKNKLLCFCLVLLVSSVYAQMDYQPSSGNLEAREEFRDNKFGIFVHYGIYSMLANGEWVLENEKLRQSEYAKLAGGFCPSRFDAAQWVSAFKASGAKYVCFTTRHHDGFSMFDTKFSDYNIVKATPFKRDIVKELADECHKQGLKIHFYYSHADWGREDYPVGSTGKNTGRRMKENWDSYYKFMNNQLTELLTNYGQVGAIWFDGHWDQDKDFDWRLPEQYNLIHRLQPDCLIGNNHHLAPIKGEDIQIFERDLPGENKAGFSSGQPVASLPLETCETMNSTWGYNIKDDNYKSVETLIHLLVKAAGKNANLLLNVGPQPDGKLPVATVERLKGIGDWMRIYGETLYGTRGGIVRDWGVTTKKKDKLYVHILDWKDKVLFLPVTDVAIKKAFVFKDKSKLSFIQNKQGVILQLPELPSEIDYIVELQLKD